MGHGWVTPRSDGNKMRCGGPRLCKECAIELALLNSNEPDPRQIEMFEEHEYKRAPTS